MKVTGDYAVDVLQFYFELYVNNPGLFWFLVNVFGMKLLLIQFD